MRRTCCGCGVFLGWTWPNSIATRATQPRRSRPPARLSSSSSRSRRTPSQGVLEHSSPNSEQTPDLLQAEALHRLEAARPTIFARAAERDPLAHACRSRLARRVVLGSGSVLDRRGFAGGAASFTAVALVYAIWSTGHEPATQSPPQLVCILRSLTPGTRTCVRWNGFLCRSPDRGRDNVEVERRVVGRARIIFC